MLIVKYIQAPRPMFKEKYFTLTIISILLLSCTQNKVEHNKIDNISDGNNMLEAFSNTIELEGEIFISDSIKLMTPNNINIVNNLLFITDTYNDKIYSVYDMETRKMITRFLNQGKGPNEFLGGMANRIIPYKKDSILLYEPFRNKMHVFSIPSIMSGSNIPTRSFEMNMKDRGDCIWGLSYFKNMLFTSGEFYKDCCRIYDATGEVVVNSFGEYPKITSKEKLDNYHIGMKVASSTHFGFNTKANKIAKCDYVSLHIYNYQFNNREIEIGEKEFSIQWIFPEMMRLGYSKDGKPTGGTLGNKTDVMMAGNMITTSKYIFIPFSKHTHRQIHSEGIEDCYDYIVVINWNGEAVAKLKLDKAIKFPLQIDSSGKHLYSIHTDTEETGLREIIRYNIECLNDL